VPQLRHGLGLDLPDPLPGDPTGTGGVARRGLGPLVRFLRERGAIPAVAGDGTSAGVLLAGYRDYLTGERGLAAESARCYVVQARKFLAGLAQPLEHSLQRLDAAAVTCFVLAQARQSASVWSAKTLVTVTRSLLRFLHVQGLIPAPLAGAVPAVAGWRLSAVPRGLDRAVVRAVLAGPDASTPAGLRDRAVLTLLARLGLRGGEAAALGLADVDRAGAAATRHRHPAALPRQDPPPGLVTMATTPPIPRSPGSSALEHLRRHHTMITTIYSRRIRPGPLSADGPS
jgi:integrase/recombinase XerD